MSGNCATGIVNRATTPASVMRIAMTIASLGRVTKMSGIILPLASEAASSCARCRNRAWCDRNARAHPGLTLDDHLLPRLEAVQHNGRAVAQDLHLHASLLGFIVGLDDQ